MPFLFKIKSGGFVTATMIIVGAILSGTFAISYFLFNNHISSTNDDISVDNYVATSTEINFVESNINSRDDGTATESIEIQTQEEVSMLADVTQDTAQENDPNTSLEDESSLTEVSSNELQEEMPKEIVLPKLDLYPNIPDQNAIKSMQENGFQSVVREGSLGRFALENDGHLIVYAVVRSSFSDSEGCPEYVGSIQWGYKSFPFDDKYDVETTQCSDGFAYGEIVHKYDKLKEGQYVEVNFVDLFEQRVRKEIKVGVFSDEVISCLQLYAGDERILLKTDCTKTKNEAKKWCQMDSENWGTNRECFWNGKLLQLENVYTSGNSETEGKWPTKFNALQVQGLTTGPFPETNWCENGEYRIVVAQGKKPGTGSGDGYIPLTLELVADGFGVSVENVRYQSLMVGLSLSPTNTNDYVDNFAICYK